ncbi:MAG: putative oxidoreductase [Candidatus Heimdallarchaeota archaeon LC_2]|nr:MAG: putative oxidoreductase [Candidatus Heimdallarchaeota archaeon LC_2]
MEHQITGPILITGASTGIGRCITELLSAKGYTVYAGARKQTDLDELDQIENVKAIKLDVTNADQIENMVQLIKNEGKGLYAVVNNAGVGDSGPLIEFQEENFDFLINVNIKGPFRITKAVADFIIESKGRIITIGSISGILSSAFLGPYSMSKHAMEAYSDSLSLEMKKFDVKVSLIEPGNYDSAIVRSATTRAQLKPNFLENTKYGEELQTIREGADSESGDRSNFKPPDEVADAIYDALTSDIPKARYMVTPDLEEATRTIDKAISELIQLNENPKYSFSPEQLGMKIKKFMEEGIPSGFAS